MHIVPFKYMEISGLCLLLGFVFPSYAQEGIESRVYAAEGGTFVLNSGGQRTVYAPESLGAGGFSLHNGDVIQTNPGTFVEILLAPGGRAIKIAENTSLAYNRADGREPTLELSYGRIRLFEGGGGFGGRELLVRAGSAEIVFRGGDLGIDYTIQPSGGTISREPVLRLSVFSGSAALIPLARVSPAGQTGALAGTPRFQVNESEEIVLELTASLSYIERKALTGDIISYWSRYSSAAFPPLFQPPLEEVIDEEALVQAPANPVILPDYSPFIKRNAAKNSFLISGISLSLIGTVLQGVAQSSWNSGNPDNRNLNMYAGYSFIGLGFVNLCVALLINPKLPVSDAAK